MICSIINIRYGKGLGEGPARDESLGDWRRSTCALTLRAELALLVGASHAYRARGTAM